MGDTVGFAYITENISSLKNTSIICMTATNFSPLLMEIVLWQEVNGGTLPPVCLAQHCNQYIKIVTCVCLSVCNGSGKFVGRD